MSYYCDVYPPDTLWPYKYVMVFSRYQGKYLLSRHKERTTWETQGGHIEPGETPLQAAKRELFEESGAIQYQMEPLFDCRAEDARGEANGVVFLAEIEELGPLPQSEMAEVKTWEQLPENLTYPLLTKSLWRALQENSKRIDRSKERV